MAREMERMAKDKDLVRSIKKSYDKILDRVLGSDKELADMMRCGTCVSKNSSCL